MSRNSTEQRPKRRRPRKRLRLLLGAVALVGLTLGLGLWILTRSWFIVARIQPELEKRLGGDVTIDSAVYEGGGRFVLHGLSVRSRLHEGPAAEVARIGAAEIIVDAKALAAGRIVVLAVDLDEVLLRLSEDEQRSGSFSLMGLDPQWPADSGPRPKPPTVRISAGTVEVGVHSGDRYRRVGERRVSGELTPKRQEGVFDFWVHEIGEDGRPIGESGVRAGGTWDLAANRLDSWAVGLDLDQQTYDMCPNIVRFWWDEMDLVGRVTNAAVTWSEEDLLEVEFAVEDVGLSMPVEVDEFWGRYENLQAVSLDERPRMSVTSGTISFSHEHLSLRDLHGTIRSADAGVEIVGVPYRVSFDMTALPDLAWSDRETWVREIVAEAPFTLDVALEPFAIMRDESGRTPSVDVPYAVAKFLGMFQMTDWQLDQCQFVVERATGEDGTNSIATAGEAFLSRASGAFDRFPYRLDEIDAHVRFDETTAEIEFMGLGSDAVPIAVRASISPPGRDAYVDVCVSTRGAPVDDRLRSALGETHQKLFDTLLDEPAARRLEQASLLPAEGLIGRALCDLAAELATVGAAGPQPLPESIERKLRQIDRMAEHQPFDRTCRVDFDLAVEKAPGQPQVMDGRIEILGGDLLFDRFPYPIRVRNGSLVWHDRLIILEPAPGRPGLEVITAGGGSGFVSGSFAVEPTPEGSRLVPLLEFEVVEDEVNDLLLASIPLSDAEREALEPGDVWPGGTRSGAADLIDQLRIAGPLEYHGRITADATSGALDYDIEVSMRDGHATLTRDLVAGGGSGLRWPHDWTFDGVEGDMSIGTDRIVLHRLGGTFAGCRANAAGTIDRRPQANGSSFDVTFDNVGIDDHLLEVLGEESARPARSLWSRLEAQGSLGALLTYRSMEPARFALSVWPETVSIDAGGERLVLARADGAVRVHPHAIDFDRLELIVEGEESDEDLDGALRLNGRYEVGADGDRESWDLRVDWLDGRFESPLIREAMDRVAAPTQASLYRRYRPRGRFDGTLRYLDGAYRIELHPETLEVELDGEDLSLVFGDASPGAGAALNAIAPNAITPLPIAPVVIEPGRIELSELSLEDGDDRCRLSGLITVDERLDVALDLDYDGEFMDDSIQMLLPDVVRRALQAIAFEDGEVSRISDGRLRMSQPLPEPGQEPERADRTLAFTCDVLTEGARFDAGLLFENVDARMHIETRHEPGVRPLFRVRIDDGAFDALGQRLDGARGAIQLDARGDLVLRDFEAELYGGGVAATARVGLGGEFPDYALEVQLVGVAVEPFLDDAVFEPLPPPPGATPASSEGRIYAGVAMSGVAGRPDLRCGRGHVRVLGGMTNVPLVFKVLQVAHLSWPMLQDLAYAESEFYIMGDRLKFEGILFESIWGDAAPLQLLGEGEMNLTTYELDTRFRSRGGWLVVRDVLGTIGDQIFVIRVTGPLGDPDANLVPLPGLSRPQSLATPDVPEGVR